MKKLAFTETFFVSLRRSLWKNIFFIYLIIESKLRMKQIFAYYQPETAPSMGGYPFAADDYGCGTGMFRIEPKM